MVLCRILTPQARFWRPQASYWFSQPCLTGLRFKLRGWRFLGSDAAMEALKHSSFSTVFCGQYRVGVPDETKILIAA
jgi:hypothetical protein